MVAAIRFNGMDSGHENKKIGRDIPKIVDYYFKKSMHIAGLG